MLSVAEAAWRNIKWHGQNVVSSVAKRRLRASGGGRTACRCFRTGYPAYNRRVDVRLRAYGNCPCPSCPARIASLGIYMCCMRLQNLAAYLSPARLAVLCLIFKRNHAYIDKQYSERPYPAPNIVIIAVVKLASRRNLRA